MTKAISPLERARLDYRPRRPRALAAGAGALSVETGEPTTATRDADQVRQRFPKIFGAPAVRFVPGDGTPAGPLRVGVVLSGGQAPGGHNVITGLFDALTEIHSGSALYGFLGGPAGIFGERYEKLTAERLAGFRNTGGFDLLRSGRDKIETPEQLAASLATVQKLELDGLVIVGGDDSNTNAAILAEYFLDQGATAHVVGVPKTIDGDMKSEQVEISFGFDTATKLYSELIGNIARDARSAGKYWHFIKLMGRSASHVTLECALRTQPNVALIGEEVEAKQWTLREIVEQLVGAVKRRADAGRPYGVCLVSEGLIEFIPEMRRLIDELNQVISEHAAALGEQPSYAARRELVAARLGADSRAVFDELPERIQAQLLLDRDSHGNVQVSKIDTEQLLIEKVTQRLAELQARGEYGGKFQVQAHFLGYEGRAAAPSDFDCDYTYALGQVAAMLIAFGRTGYLCSLRQLSGPVESWEPVGVPLTSLMQIEERKGKPTPVIGKALVRLDDEPFKTLAASRDTWEESDAYVYPGPIQYFGPPEIAGDRSRTLVLERGRG